MSLESAPRYDRLLQVRAPVCFVDALDAAANKNLTSRSDYIRLALLARLKADGIDPAGPQDANLHLDRAGAAAG